MAKLKSLDNVDSSWVLWIVSTNDNEHRDKVHSFPY